MKPKILKLAGKTFEKSVFRKKNILLQFQLLILEDRI